MSIYIEVNPHLQTSPYRFLMPEKRRRPGSPKGQPKPTKRKLDPEFHTRLKQAMGDMLDAELARKAGCTRQAIGQYVSGDKTGIDVFILFDIAAALGVDARWLALGGTKPAEKAPLPDYLKRDRRVAEADRRGNGSQPLPVLHQPGRAYRKER